MMVIGAGAGDYWFGKSGLTRLEGGWLGLAKEMCQRG